MSKKSTAAVPIPKKKIVVNNIVVEWADMGNAHFQPDDKDKSKTAVDEISEIMSVMTEETFSPVVTAARSFSDKFDELNGKAGKTFLPVLTAAKSFSDKFEELNDEATALIFPDAQEEQRDDNLWNSMLCARRGMLACGGTRECLEGVNDGFTDYVFPFDNDEDSFLTPEEKKISEKAFLAAAAFHETKYKEKKSIKRKRSYANDIIGLHFQTSYS
jgi:hypothetical protein